MDDLIKRCDVLEDIDEDADRLRTVLDEMDLVGIEREKFGYGLGFLEALIDDIKQIPSAERKGKWIEHHAPFTWMGYTYWTCSECGFGEDNNKIRSNFCQSCGADMREWREND
jgi:hypothetical protein